MRLWRAVSDMATVWRSSAYVQEYLTGARARLELCGGRGGDHIEAQPFFLPMYLPTVSFYSPSGSMPGSGSWEDVGLQLARGYTTTIEWLRSRLAGYPFPGTPLLDPASPWTTFSVSMRVPWLVEKRRWRLEERSQPPIMPFLATDRAVQARTGTELGAAVVSSPAAAEVAQCWRALSEEDREGLHRACVILQQARYPEPDDVRGDEDFRQLAWSEFILDEAMRTLPVRARAFNDALIRADRLIQQTAALFCQLIMFRQIRQLRNIGYVEQLVGADGWHTVKSDSYVFEPVRRFEIVGFDCPYPRGVMLVEGVIDRLSLGSPQQGSVTVYGRTLPDSEELAASAVPI